MMLRSPPAAHARFNASSEPISVISKSAAAAFRNPTASIPLTSRCVARIFNPAECMLTKAIIMRFAPASSGWSR